MKKVCERCGKSLEGLAHTTSKLNTEVICMECKQEERAMQLYKFASCIEDEQCRAGNLNYEGVLNDRKYCLLDFKTKISGEIRHFKFVGINKLYDEELCPDELYIIELNHNGKSIEELKSWKEVEIPRMLAFAEAVNQMSRKEKDVEIIHLHDTLKTFLNEVVTDEVAVTCAGREVPKYISKGCFNQKYELLLCTENYAYYGDEEFLVTDACTGKLLADNAFAENGYWQSLEAINKGEDKILYIREGYEDAVNEQLDEIRKEMNENE